MRRSVGRLATFLVLIGVAGCSSSTTTPVHISAPVVDQPITTEVEKGGDPGEVIEHALKARCAKPEDLEKQNCQKTVFDGKVFVYPARPSVDTHRVIQFDGLGRVRWDTEFALPEGKTLWVMSLTNNLGWRLLQGEVQDLSFNDAVEFKMEIYGRYFATLLPLKDKSTHLTLLADAQVDGGSAFVVKATARFRPDVLLYFSKEAYQLLKISYKAQEAGATLRKEHLFSDYKLIDGLMLPTKMVDMLQKEGQPLQKAAEFTIKEYEFLPKLKDEVFEKPTPKK